MATYYLSPTGNDTTGNGSSGNPWLTFSKAYTEASNDDIIYCLPGTYTFVSWGTVTKRLTFTSADPKTCIFDGAGATIAVAALFNSLSFKISNITFTNWISSSKGFNIRAASSELLIENCIFHNITINTGDANYGFFTSNGTSGSILTLKSCILRNFKQSSPTGDCGVFLGNDSTGICYINMYNVTYVSTLSVSEQMDSMVGWWGANAVFTIKNCIFYSNSGTTNSFKGSFGTAGSYIVSNTVFYGIGSLSGTNISSSDPLFVDVGNNILELRRLSTARNTGIIT